MALDLYARPGQIPAWRASALPQGVGAVLRVAAGQAEAVSEAAQSMNVDRELAVAAARFFVEQLLLAREVAGDPWRVLGVSPGCEETQLREHRHWLMRLVHPDLSPDWADAYAARVHDAWRRVKAGAGGSAPAVDSAATDIADDWEHEQGLDSRRVAYSPPSVPALEVLPSPSTPVKGLRLLRRVIGGVAVSLVLVAIVWGPALEDALRDDQVAALGGGFAGERDPAEAVSSGFDSSPPEQSPPASAQSVPVSTSPAAVVSKQSVSSGAPSPLAAATQTTSSLPACNGADCSSLPSVVSVTSDEPTSEVTAGAVSAGESRDAHPGTAALDSVPDAAKIDRSRSRPRQENPIVPPELPVQAVAARASTPLKGESIPKTPNVPDRIEVPDVVAGQAPHAAEPVASNQATVSVNDLAPVLAVSGVSDPAPVKSPPSMVGGSADSRGSVPPTVATSSSTPAMRPDAGQAPRPLPSIADAAGLLKQFQSHYAEGDIVSLLGLFAADAHVEKGGPASLAADYGKLFNESTSRDIAFNDVRWQVEGQSLVGLGAYQARISRQDRIFRQKIAGSVRLQVVRVGERTLFRRLEPVRSNANR